jgi:BlaI family penicillinase repressor
MIPEFAKGRWGADVARHTRISPTEWEVMEMVWRRGTVTAAEVISSLGAAREWNQSTVRTLLARLVEKGTLRFEANANRYVYRAAITRQCCVRQESRSFLDKIFGGDVNSLLAHFVRESGVSAEELDSLKRLAARKTRPAR